MAASRWYIPAARMKMKDTHIVPLSSQAKASSATEAISFGRDFVFPVDVTPKVHERQHPSVLPSTGGYRGRMTGHGFRGVASTILHELAWPHEHIELQLAHQERDAISAAYNHALYLEPRARMMQAWADYLVDACRQANEKACDRHARSVEPGQRIAA